ncbi:MAG: hypothetical protein IID16_03130 [Candidatus Marinimicrobia bacterium]|nr:hypothetical protein [Candidatus Neomarinimicrobiota bacterium]
MNACPIGKNNRTGVSNVLSLALLHPNYSRVKCGFVWKNVNCHPHLTKHRDEHVPSRHGEKTGKQADHTSVWASLNRDISPLTTHQLPVTNIKPQLKHSSKSTHSILRTVHRA